MVVAEVTFEGLLNGSWVCTVAIAEQAPAIRLCALVRKTTLVALAGLIVWTWVAEVSVASERVRVGVPDLVSLKKKLWLLVLIAMVRVVTTAVQAASE